MSTLRVDTVQDAGGRPLYGARAWVNFDASGVIAVRNGANISSIADLGVGGYTANMSSAQADATYSVVCTSGPATTHIGSVINAFVTLSSIAYATPSTTSFSMAMVVATIGYRDSAAVTAVVNR